MKRTALFALLLLLPLLLLPLPKTAAEAPADGPFIDLDLSKMSGTIVYAQILNLLYEPEAYLGKTIRMAGWYNYFNDEANGVVYHACIVPDATACCAQGIEFVRAGEHPWPADYPAIGSDILVTGRLEIYQDAGVSYLHLVDSDMQVLKEAESE